MGSVSLPLEPVVEGSVELATSGDKVAPSEWLEGLAVEIDLQTPLVRLGAIDGVYVVLEDIPPASASRPDGGTATTLGHWRRAN